jgi:hypothetical protein
VEFKINTADKPKLEALMKSDSAKAKEIIGTFVSLIEESLDDSNAIPWVDLPEKFGGGLTFPQLIKGILHGALDLQNINPDLYDVLKEELHPLSMLTPRKDAMSGATRYHDWRNHFRLSPGTPVNQDAIESIFRKLLRYYKYVNIDDLAGALMYNQIATFKGMGDASVQKLPFFPALRYQKETQGELHVGKFIDSIGALDCGYFDEEWDDKTCPACKLETLKDLSIYSICLSCNAGFEHPDTE